MGTEKARERTQSERDFTQEKCHIFPTQVPFTKRKNEPDLKLIGIIEQRGQKNVEQPRNSYLPVISSRSSF